MGKSKSNNTATVIKVILLIVSGLAFVSLAIATFKTTGSTVIGSSSGTSTTGAELLKNIGDNGTSEAGQALTAMQWTYLCSLIGCGALCVLSLLSLAFEKMGIFLAKLVAILVCALVIITIICGYIYASKISVSAGGLGAIKVTLSFMPWFMLIIACVYTILVFFAFKRK